jgi:multidrug efflux pump subunit AcrA (membrane-fusion protein)
MPTDLRPPATRRGATATRENGRGPRGSEATGLAARFRRQPVLNSVLLALCVVAIVLAVSAIGPSTQSSGASTRTTTAKQGVVQSTVSGSGNIQSSSQLDLGFKTSGTVTHIDVKEGQQVVQGQLLGTLDAKSTEASLQQAEATLKSAEASLAQLEEDEGESTGGSTNGGTGSTSAVSYTTYSTATTTTPSESQAPTTSTGTATTPAPSTHKSSKPAASSSGGSGSSSGSGTGSQSTGSSTTQQSAATREANLASARATVKSDQVSVESAEKAVQNTKLYAPQDGTIVSLSGEVGETVSATGTSKASASTPSSSSTGSGATGASTAGASSSSQTSASGSGGSSSSFAVLSDLESMQLVVGLSESEIGQVHTGQIATVTIEALSGRKVAAHVAKVAQLATSSSGAASYDVTFQLDQQTPGLKIGMSATAEVVVKQAEGVNVTTSAIKGGSVTVIRGGKQVTQPVTTGLAGDSTTIVLSGLKAGEKVLLPSVSSTGSSSSSSSSSRLGRSSRGGFSGGGFAGGGFAAGGGLPSGGPPG